MSYEYVRQHIHHQQGTYNFFVMDINSGNKIQMDINGTYEKPVSHNHHEATAPTTADNSHHQKKEQIKRIKLYS